MNPRNAVALLRGTFSEWREDKASRLAAALAYFALFAIAPLLVLLIMLAGLVLGQEAAQGRLVDQIGGIVGPENARLIETMIANATQRNGGGVLATLIGLGALIFGATGLFMSVQDALNTIWGVQPVGGGFVGSLQAQLVSRLWGFLLVVLISLLLIAAVVATAVLAVVTGPLANLVPGFSVLWFLLNVAISFAVVTLIFAAVYRVLPAVETAWRDVWIGAAVTALLFVIGKELIGLYLGRVSVGSVYGAAGSLVVLLVWIYYSANIFLFGAEFTQVYARRRGRRLRPAPGAVPVGKQAPAAAVSPTREAAEQTRRPGERPPVEPGVRPEGEVLLAQPAAERAAGRPQGRRPSRLVDLWASVLAGAVFGFLLGLLGRPPGKE